MLPNGVRSLNTFSNPAILPWLSLYAACNSTDESSPCNSAHTRMAILILGKLGKFDPHFLGQRLVFSVRLARRTWLRGWIRRVIVDERGFFGFEERKRF